MRSCCYCEKTVTQNEMTRVPQESRRKIQWAEALGPRYEYLSESKSNGYICLSHFELDRYGRRHVDSIPKPDLEEDMPIDLNTINLHFLRHDHTYCKDLEKMPPLMRSRELSVCSKQRCCYCEKSMTRKNMTTVPQDMDRRNEWAKILGPRFEYNSGLKNNGYICLSHFELDKHGRRKYSSNPRPDLNPNFDEQDIPQTSRTSPDDSL